MELLRPSSDMAPWRKSDQLFRIRSRKTSSFLKILHQPFNFNNKSHSAHTRCFKLYRYIKLRNFRSTKNYFLHPEWNDLPRYKTRLKSFRTSEINSICLGKTSTMIWLLKLIDLTFQPKLPISKRKLNFKKHFQQRLTLRKIKIKLTYNKGLNKKDHNPWTKDNLSFIYSRQLSLLEQLWGASSW